MPEKPNLENKPEVKDPKLDTAEQLAEQKVSPEMVKKIQELGGQHDELLSQMREHNIEKFDDPFTGESYELLQGNKIKKMSTNDQIKLIYQAGMPVTDSKDVTTVYPENLLLINDSIVASMLPDTAKKPVEYVSRNLPLMFDKYNKFNELFKLAIKKKEDEKASKSK